MFLVLVSAAHIPALSAVFDGQPVILVEKTWEIRPVNGRLQVSFLTF